MGNLSAIRRVMLSLTGLVLVALIAYAAYWYYIAGQIRDQIEPWAQARAAEGYVLRWDHVEVTGFPGSFRIAVTQLNVSTTRPVPVTIDAAEASVWAMPWNLRHWEFTAPQGAQLLEPTRNAGFAARHFDGAFEAGDTAASAVDVTALDLSGIGLAQGITVGDAEAHIDVPPVPPRSHTDPSLTLALQVNQTKLPNPVPAFGDTLSGFSFAAQIKGALPPGSFVPALTHWRDDGGTIELQSLRLRWGSLLVDASGTLALDSALQPEGALSATITGQDAAVDVAVMTGALKPEAAGAAKAVLGLLAKPNAQGEKAISLPLTLQNQQLFLGPAKIAALPTVPWD
jgi:hypothetical protein